MVNPSTQRDRVVARTSQSRVVAGAKVSRQIQGIASSTSVHRVPCGSKNEGGQISRIRVGIQGDGSRCARYIECFDRAELHKVSVNESSAASHHYLVTVCTATNGDCGLSGSNGRERNGVVTLRCGNRVGTTTTCDAVVARTTEDGVCGRATGDGVVACSGVDAVCTTATHKGVVTLTTEDGVCGCTGGDRVVARSGVDAVRTTITYDGVGIRTTGDGVSCGATRQAISTGIARDDIRASATGNGVVSVAARQRGVHCSNNCHRCNGVVSSATINTHSGT